MIMVNSPSKPPCNNIAQNIAKPLHDKVAVGRLDGLLEFRDFHRQAVVVLVHSFVGVVF